jgi:hypothetical protein
VCVYCPKLLHFAVLFGVVLALERVKEVRKDEEGRDISIRHQVVVFNLPIVDRKVGHDERVRNVRIDRKVNQLPRPLEVLQHTPPSVAPARAHRSKKNQMSVDGVAAVSFYLHMVYLIILNVRM